MIALDLSQLVGYTRSRDKKLISEGHFLKMNFGIDYDGTFGEDPKMFRKMVDLIHLHGHKCVVVTQRPDNSIFGHDDIIKDLRGKIDFICAGDMWKEEAAKEKGWHIDVWIEDFPEGVKAPPVLIGSKVDVEMTKNVMNALWLSNKTLEDLNDEKRFGEIIENNYKLIRVLQNKESGEHTHGNK